MAQQVISLGTNPNDHLGEQLRAGGSAINNNFTEIYNLQSQTINAGAVDYNFTGATFEQRIALADADCVTRGFSRLYIPAFMLPYVIALCPASPGVQRLREGGESSVYDVLAYGAVGNGITDDTLAIQAALDAAGAATATGGRNVYLPSGTYLVSKATTGAWCLLGKTNANIYGAGAGATTVKLATNQPSATRLIALAAGSDASPTQIASNVLIQNVILDGNGTNQPLDAVARQSHLIMINGGSNIRVDHCLLQNASGDGILNYALPPNQVPDSIQIENNKFLSCGRWAVAVVGGTNVTIMHNLAQQCNLGAFDIEPDADTFVLRDIMIANNVVAGWVGAASSGGAITATGRSAVDSENFRRINISNNIVDGQGTALGAGIEVDMISEVVLSGNTIRLPGTHGLWLRGNRYTVTGNIIRDVPEIGIAISAVGGAVINVSRLVITGNLIEHYGTAAARDGIQASSIVDSVIANNVVYDAVTNGTYGIRLVGTCLRNLVEGNHVYNPLAIAGGSNAIHETSPSDFNSIIGNSVGNFAGTIGFSGAATIVENNRGYNPRGNIAGAPAVPSSTVTATNNTGGWIMVIIAAGAAQVTAVTIAGVATGLQVLANDWGTCRVGPNQTIALTYGAGAPTWKWFGD